MKQVGWVDTHQQSGFACTTCRWSYAIPAHKKEVSLQEVAQAFWSHQCSPSGSQTEIGAVRTGVSKCNKVRLRGSVAKRGSRRRQHLHAVGAA